MARLYGYCRKSTEEQNETSFSVQEEYIRNYARNIEGIDEIIIITETGSGSSLEGRPQFKSLLNTLCPNDIVSVYDSSRISRNTEDALSIIRTISQKGARLMVAGKFIDPNSPIDTMLWSVQSSFDTYQRQIQNQKSRQGIDAKKLSGDWVMRGDLFGYKTYRTRGKTIVEVDEDASKVVKYVYSEYLKGRSTFQISQSLENTVVPTQPETMFTPCFIRRMLAKPIYMGYYSKDKLDNDKIFSITKAELKAKLVKSNLYQPIVDEETWWKVFDNWRSLKRTHSKQYNYRYSYYEGSTIIHCPECNVGYMHSYKKDNRREAVSDVYLFGRHNGKCSLNTYRWMAKDSFELMMRTAFFLTMDGGVEVGGFFEDRKDKINLSLEENRRLLESLEQKLGENKKKSERIIDAIMDGLVDKETVRDRMNSLKEEKDRLSRQIEDINHNIRGFESDLEDIMEEESTNTVEEFIHSSSTKRRTLYRKFIHEGTFDGKEFRIRYRNGKEYVFTMWASKKKKPSTMDFTVSFRGEKQYDGTINLNEGTISIYYAEKSIKNTPRGYDSSNDSLFVKYAEKGLEKMCSTVNEQLRLCRENSVDDVLEWTAP